MNFHKTLAVLVAAFALAAPGFCAVNSPTLLTLKGLAGGDEFGLPDNQPATGWPELVLKVARNGSFTPGNGDIPATLGLAKIKGPKDATHHSDYINIWGFVDESGTFVAFFVTLVSEAWTLKGDTWVIEQWLHMLDMEGTGQRASYAVITEKLDGQVLDYKPEAMEVQGPPAVQNRNALLEMWKAYKPQPKAK
ncbi:MAG: hypothetical protein HY748_07215 [Elusimicrobia bacterium]|nr:hypothetical protein [Elusimicrobiota bacterium]